MNRLLLKECLDELRSDDSVELTESHRILDEGKDRLIDRLPSLDDAQKAQMKQFFAKRPSLESKFDWNRPETITWDAFQSIANGYEDPIDPDTVPEFSDKRDEGDGIVSYEVQDDQDGQLAVRRIVDAHWGRGANPWCLIARDISAGGLSGAVKHWRVYSSLPKRIAFKGDYPVAFMATDGDHDALRDEYEEWLEDNGLREGLFSFEDWYLQYAPEELKWADSEVWWDRRDDSHPSVHDCVISTPRKESAVS